MLDEDHQRYSAFKKKYSELSEQNLLAKLKLDRVPKTGKTIFNELVQTWRQGDLRTLKDILEYYIKADVVPLLQIIIKMAEKFNAEEISVFQSFITLPSLVLSQGLRYSFRNWDPADGGYRKLAFLEPDLQKLIRLNLFGGISQVGHLIF